VSGLPLYSCLLFLFSCTALSAITVDGSVEDWVGLPSESVNDPVGDPEWLGADFVALAATQDDYNLYLRVEFAAPINIRTSGLRLYLDADDNSETGVPFDGRGMDLIWDFDRNRGTNSLASRSDVGRGNLLSWIAPDDFGSIFEIAVNLEVLPAVREGRPLHLFFNDDNSRDRIPDQGSILSIVPSGPLGAQPEIINPDRNAGSLRLLSWNVLRDNVFDGTANRAAFLRVLQALQADILLLQEIYETDSSEVLAFIEENFQVQAGGQWYLARNYDCITVSRFPIERSWLVDGNLVTRVDTRAQLGRYTVIANVHFPCCSNESGRVREAGNLLATMETALAEAAYGPQAAIVAGDLNSGGLAPELILLRNGERSLEMANCRHLEAWDQYTWGSLGSSFGSSKLDFFLFEPAQLFRDKAFVLDTDLLSLATLDRLGLEADDTFVSDHLPLVLDVRAAQLPQVLQAPPLRADGSTVSPWLGQLHARHYPWIKHNTLGWLALETVSGGAWGWSENGLWLWLAPDTWPWIWIPRFE
jgi:endonuclease/exonuclease/phosphatase family metal-dependent hydrolase